MNTTVQGLKMIAISWDMKQISANITIRQSPPELDIDYTAMRASMGYQEPLAFQLSFSQQAQEAARQGIERRTTEGLILENSRAGKAAFAKLVRQEEKKDIGTLVLSSLAPVRITVRPQPVQFKVETGGVRLQVDLRI